MSNEMDREEREWWRKRFAKDGQELFKYDIEFLSRVYPEVSQLAWIAWRDGKRTRWIQLNNALTEKAQREGERNMPYYTPEETTAVRYRVEVVPQGSGTFRLKASEVGSGITNPKEWVIEGETYTSEEAQARAMVVRKTINSGLNQALGRIIEGLSLPWSVEE